MSPPPYALAHSVLALAALGALAWPTRAFAIPYCSAWSPALVAAPSTTIGSKAITLTAEAGPSNCYNYTGGDWLHTDHLLLVRREGATPPTSPTNGTPVYNGTTVAYTDLVQRSDKLYSYAVFACENAGSCSTWYAGTGAGSDESITTVAADDNVAYATTDVEHFELKQISGESDTSSYILKTAGANAPEAFFYPTGWTYGGGLAMYSSVGAFGGTPSKIYWQRYTGSVDSDSWPTDVNDSTSWTSTTLVAEGKDGTYDDHFADHVWVMLTDDGTKRVQLFAQSQWSGADNDQIIQIESITDIGDSFGLGCTTSCVARMSDLGYTVITADGTVTTHYVHDARHGRILWDYIANGAVDPGSDTPSMLFMLQRPLSGSCADTTEDDIGLADGVWSGTEWEWTVFTDDTSPYCPVIQVDQGHDPTVVALPGGEYKVYYRSWDDGFYHVVYWDGSAWEDDALIEFYWDGMSSGGPDHECINNLSAANKLTPIAGYAKEGLFFRILDSDDGECGIVGGGLDDDPGSTSSDVNDAAIVFAQLVNG